MGIMEHIRRILLAKRYDEVLCTAARLRPITGREAIEKYQVEAFNRVWKDAYENVPFYARWMREHGLSESIRSLAELECWPILTKADLRKREDFTRTDCAVPKKTLATGGSTGEPLVIPCWAGGGDGGAGVSQWIGRAAYGVLPGDKTFLLWGHQHLYGKGFRRFVNARMRAIKDWISNFVRVSAYDLSESAMKHAMRVFLKAKPKLVIGFTPAVIAFCRHNRDLAGKFKFVKAVLCTAGPLSEDEKAEVEGFFSAKVCMEYGSVECAIMGYARPSDGEYSIFWNTHLLQAVRDGDGEYKNIVTRLTRHYVPLIRYDIGDYLALRDDDREANGRSVLEAIHIKGRPSEIVKFSNGVSFFGALIGDCVKQVADVVSSQIAVDEGGNRLEIRVVAARELAGEDKELIKNRFALTVQDAGTLDFKVVQVAKLHMTEGGKIPRIVRLQGN